MPGATTDDVLPNLEGPAVIRQLLVGYCLEAAEHAVHSKSALIPAMILLCSMEHKKGCCDL